MPEFLTPEFQVLVYSVLVFFVLLALLWKFAWGPIMQALEQREHNIQKRIDDAEKCFRDAEAKIKQYEQLIHKAKDDAAEIIAEGKRDVEKLKDQIIAEANTESAKQMERAKREIELARQAAVQEIRDRVVDLTAELSSKVIEREINAEDHRRFIQEAIGNVDRSMG